MRKIPLLLLGVLLLQSNSCSCEDTIFDNTDNRLQINNQSDKDIYFYWQTNYPDTIIVDSNPYPSSEEFYIERKKQEPISLYGRTWEQEFQNRITSDTLQVFIYDAEVLGNTPWEEVRENYLVLKRYELSYQDILDRNWIIEFTGQ